MADINKLCDELEALLKAATPGPWKARNALVYLGGHGGFSLHNCPDPEENAALISALHTAAHLLIDAARESVKLRGILDEACALVGAHKGNLLATLIHMKDDNRMLRERIKELKERGG